MAISVERMCPSVVRANGGPLRCELAAGHPGAHKSSTRTGNAWWVALPAHIERGRFTEVG